MLPFTDPVLIFTILLSVAFIGPVLGSKLGIPDIVMILLAGMLIGENAFGILERGESIILFGEIGLLYIMFLAGLEIDLYEFSRTRSKSISFGLITFIIPQLVGAVMVYMILGDLSWASAVLIASMFASHTLLAYPIAGKLGIQRTEPVTISVGATIITDTLALLVLAVVLEVADDTALSLYFWGSLVLSLVVMVLLIWLIVPRVARWVFKHVSESGGTQFLFVLSVVCLCAYLSEYARMKPLIGAFLAGAALNRQIPEHSPLMNRLEFVGNFLFIPFFLISVGMLVDPQVLFSSVRTWQVIGVMVGLVLITKFIAAWITGTLYGYSGAERSVMFGLTVVQAAATLAAALVGFDAGLVSESTLNGAIAMIMVTVPMGSWLVQRGGRKVALTTRATSRSKTLEQRIILAVNNPRSAEALMELGLLLRDTSLPGELIPLTIIDDQQDSEHAVTDGEKLLANCINQASAANMEVNAHLRADLNPADGLKRAVRELRATTVISGWRNEQNRSNRLFGSVQQSLADSCPSRLMLCRFTHPIHTNKILRVPLPPLAEHRSDLGILVREAKNLAKQAGLDVHVYLSGAPAEGLAKLFEKTPPGCEVRFTIHPTWRESRQALLEDIRKNDLLLFPQIRRDTALWTPTLDKFPETVARRFPDLNLIVVYPDNQATHSNVDLAALSETEDFPEARGVDITPEAKDSAVLEELVRQGMPDAPGMSARALELLTDSARITPVELAEGVMLLHAHCGQRAQPLLLAGVLNSHHSFFDQPAPRILIALLSPDNAPPEIHLRALSRVAKRFRNPDVVEALSSASSAVEVCRILTLPPGPSIAPPDNTHAHTK